MYESFTIYIFFLSKMAFFYILEHFLLINESGKKNSCFHMRILNLLIGYIFWTICVTALVGRSFLGLLYLKTIILKLGLTEAQPYHTTAVGTARMQTSSYTDACHQLLSIKVTGFSRWCVWANQFLSSNNTNNFTNYYCLSIPQLISLILSQIFENQYQNLGK